MTDFATNVSAVKRAIMFKPELSLKVRQGDKTQTRRMGKRGYKVGELMYIRSDYKKLRVDCAAIIRVTGVRHERVGEISEADAIKEGFANAEEFSAKFAEIHRGTTFHTESMWWVIDFELVETNPNWMEFVDYPPTRIDENGDEWSTFRVNEKESFIYCERPNHAGRTRSEFEVRVRLQDGRAVFAKQTMVYDKRTGGHIVDAFLKRIYSILKQEIKLYEEGAECVLSKAK